MLRSFFGPAIGVLTLLAVACGTSAYSTKTISSGSPTVGPTSAVAAVAPTTPLSASGAASASCGSGGSSGIGTLKRTGQRKYDSAPARVIDPDKNYVAKMQTSRGEVDMLLAAKDVTNTVNNFVFLACSGFYDGLTFHRVEPNFVVQGGDPNADGSGGPGYQIKRETSPKWLHDTGALAMARSTDPDSAGSQFYITLTPQPGLDNSYSVFGRVLTGMEVVRQIQIGDKIVGVNIEEH
jgi:peptidylprolyl isomerase